MGGDPDSRIGDRRCSACVPSPPARHSTIRLSLLLAGFWLTIGHASSPQVRAVRVPIVNGADIPFTHVSREKAPAFGIVNRIVQDDQGFLWFGFYHGLQRYDGYQFRAFLHEPEDPNSTSSVNVRALF